MRRRWGTSRVEAFSDGVFAIAITLLVLDINVPEADLDHLARALADLWPTYLAYLISFLAIGGVWLEHHRLFSCLRRVDGMLMRRNLLLLLFVSFLPFPTRLTADAVTVSREAERVAVALYGATLLLIALTLALMWRHAARERELLEEDVADVVAEQAERRSFTELGLYALGITLGVVVLPRLAAIGYLAVALWSVVDARGERQAQPGRDVPSG